CARVMATVTGNRFDVW
nr:immunoglobulin heavy chain junction region [Macaca mulatta]